MNDIARIINMKWSLGIREDDLMLFIFDYEWTLAEGKTELHRSERLNDNTIRMRFRTSYGAFHQGHIDYNMLLVLILEDSSGALADLQRDMLFATITYPDTVSRQSLSCPAKVRNSSMVNT